MVDYRKRRAEPAPIDIDGEVVVLEPHCQISDLLPIGCLIVVSDQAYHHHELSNLNDGVGVVFGSTGGD